MLNFIWIVMLYNVTVHMNCDVVQYHIIHVHCNDVHIRLPYMHCDNVQCYASYTCNALHYTSALWWQHSTIVMIVYIELRWNRSYQITSNSEVCFRVLCSHIQSNWHNSLISATIICGFIFIASGRGNTKTVSHKSRLNSSQAHIGPTRTSSIVRSEVVSFSSNEP